MTTLIASFDSDGCTKRCDAKCYEAKEPQCDCICGGKNHGAGEAQAVANTAQWVESWIDAWKEQHPGDECVVQFALPIFQEAAS